MKIFKIEFTCVAFETVTAFEYIDADTADAAVSIWRDRPLNAHKTFVSVQPV